MKLQKSFDLLNSEGPLVQIQKIGELWHWKFHTSNISTVTSTREILDFISGNIDIKDHNGKTYRWNDYGMSMKGDTPEYIQKIVLVLLGEEMEKCKRDINYFTKIYCKTK